MSKKTRGEVSFKLGGTEYKMVADFETKFLIEEEIGAGFEWIVFQAMQQKLGILDRAKLIMVALNNADNEKKVTLADVKNMFDEYGYNVLYEPVREFLGYSLGGTLPEENREETYGGTKKK